MHANNLSFIHEEMVARWSARLEEWRRLGVRVDGATIAEEILVDLRALSAGENVVSLTEAAKQTGYTPDSLGRLIRGGKLTNYGRKHAPRVRLSECPTKGHQPANLAGRYANAYHPVTDARSLVGSRR